MRKRHEGVLVSSEYMSVTYCMLTVVIWWCICCYLLIIYCNKLYKSFCFWWWNRNEKQKYNTDINICTNKSRPFIHETEHARYMQSSSFGSKKNWLLVKLLSWLLNWLLTFKTGTWQFFWLLPCQVAIEIWNISCAKSVTESGLLKLLS